MTDLFWYLATSHLALGIIAGVLCLAVAVGFVPLVKYVPVIGPYVPVAKLVAFLAFGLLCALLDRRSADARAEIAQLKRDLSFAALQISNNAATAEVKARLVEASGAAARVAEMKANTYEQWLALQPSRVGDCDALSDADVDWLQNVRPRRDTRRAGVGTAIGQSLARLRGSGKRP